MFHVPCFIFHDCMKSFTLVEILIVIAILGGLAGLAFPIMRSLLIANYLTSSAEEIVQCLRQAQTNAMGGARDSKWGVFFDQNNNKFTLFKGDFFGQDHSYDLAQELPKSIEIKNISLNGGGAEIVFEKTSGKTNQFGSLTLEGLNNQTKNIIVNEYGVIEVH